VDNLHRAAADFRCQPAQIPKSLRQSCAINVGHETLPATQPIVEEPALPVCLNLSANDALDLYRAGLSDIEL
jgi:hypothetical protein